MIFSDSDSNLNPSLVTALNSAMTIFEFYNNKKISIFFNCIFINLLLFEINIHEYFS